MGPARLRPGFWLTRPRLNKGPSALAPRSAHRLPRRSCLPPHRQLLLRPLQSLRRQLKLRQKFPQLQLECPRQAAAQLGGRVQPHFPAAHHRQNRPQLCWSCPSAACSPLRGLSRVGDPRPLWPFPRAAPLPRAGLALLAGPAGRFEKLISKP